jgi:glutathione S-transferase
MAKVRSDYGIERYIDETKRLFSVLEIRLSEADWLVGDKYTIADIASYTWVTSAPMFLEIQLDEWPGLKKWHDRIDARKAVASAKNIPPKPFTQEQFEEMVKGMRAKIDAMENTDKH